MGAKPTASESKARPASGAVDLRGKPTFFASRIAPPLIRKDINGAATLCWFEAPGIVSSFDYMVVVREPVKRLSHHLCVSVESAHDATHQQAA